MKQDLTLAICMYNAERYIEDTLLCIMAQTMQEFHLLIVNDCSTDRSEQCVKAFFEKYPRTYEWVNLPENRGLCAGRRFVEEHAQTRYLLFVDADDRPHPDYVRKLYDKITSDPQLMVVGCYLEYINLEGERINGGIFIGEMSKEGFFEKAKKGKLIFMPSTSIYDREVALSVGGHCVEGFPEGKPRYQDLCEDLDLWTRMSDLYKDGKAIVVLPEVLYQYRKGDGMSMSSLGMLLRMRHIKANVRRRRNGQKDLTFIEFRKQLSEQEYKQLEREAKAADALRRAYASLKRGKLLSGVKHLAICLWNNPSYLPDKIRHNFLKG